MRIAHVAATARSEVSAAWRIRSAQLNNKVDAFSLVHIGKTSSKVTLFQRNNFISNFLSRFLGALDLMPIRLCFCRDKTLPLSAGWVGYHASNKIKKLKVDIVNLHWFTNGVLSIKNLAKIEQPIILTMHDVWPLTGACHCNLGCDKWLTGCFDCPQLGTSFFGSQVAHHLWLLKLKKYKKIKNLTIVTPSKWLGSMAKKSPLFSGRRIEVIPNCLDLDVFMPQDKRVIRLKLGLPLDKKLILFGAVEATNVTYKGYDLLIQALFKLPHHSTESYHFVVFGSKGDGRSIPYSVTFLGDLNDETDISNAYKACDVFVTPSKQDNFPSTVLEALACGLPVVGFDVGGIPEMVDHKKCGYIATSFDTDDFAKGIAWIFSSGEYKTLSQNARSKALEHYSPQVISKKYIDLYERIVVESDLN